MSNDKTEERAAFEAWFKRAYSEDSLKPMESGCYLQRGAGMAWDAWQARAALSSRPVQGGEPVAWIRYEWNKSGSKSLVFEKPAEPSLADEARGVVYEPLYAALSSAPAREPMTWNELVAACEQEYGEDFRHEGLGEISEDERAEVLRIVRIVERHHGICKE